MAARRWIGLGPSAQCPLHIRFHAAIYGNARASTAHRAQRTDLTQRFLQSADCTTDAHGGAV